jgi:hypothetical protein
MEKSLTSTILAHSRKRPEPGGLILGPQGASTAYRVSKAPHA